MDKENWRKSVINEAISWVGTPYHSGARIKHVGVDCGMLLLEVFEECKMIDPVSVEPYPHDFHLHKSEELYLEWVKKYCNIIDGNPQPGDIAVFKFGRCVSHAGIVLEWPRIIHAYVGMGVIVSSVDEAILCQKNGESRLVAVYRFRG